MRTSGVYNSSMKVQSYNIYPTMWLAVLVILVVVLLHIILPVKYNWPNVEWKAMKVPGPPGIPFIGNGHVLLGGHTEYIPTMMDLTRTYGSIHRITFIGNHMVTLTDVHDIETIMKNSQNITKSMFYKFLQPWLGTGLLTSTGERWSNRRKWLTPAFHISVLKSYTDIFNKNSAILVGTIRAHTTGQPIEINPLITLCTFDIICDTAMGTQVNAQLEGENDYVKATLRMSQLVRIRQFAPWLYRDWIFYLSPISREHRRVLNTLHGFAEKVIKERKKVFKQTTAQQTGHTDFGGKKRISFLDLLIETSEDNRHTEQVRQELDTFMTAGHHTTSTAICWALFLLGTHPHVQQQCFQELQDIFHDSDRPPTFQDLQEMKYLERVIKETLRLYPSVPIISRKLDVPINIRGYDISAGTNVEIFIYYIHRDPNLYPNPEKFDPDRFLPDAIQGRHPYSYMPFSAGPRNCIGQRFALMEEKAVLSNLLRNFKITALDKVEDIKIIAELILRPKDNLRIVFEQRVNLSLK